jgi:hypothetical protein
VVIDTLPLVSVDQAINSPEILSEIATSFCNHRINEKCIAKLITKRDESFHYRKKFEVIGLKINHQVSLYS